MNIFCSANQQRTLRNEHTGLFIIIGMTFRGSPGLESDFSKKIFNDQKKILVKSFYDYKILFLRNHI